MNAVVDARTRESLTNPGRVLDIALVVHDLRDYPGHSRYTKILANEFSRTHNVTVFANVCERPTEVRWEAKHVRALRSNALACVRTFPLGMRTHAAALSKFDIQHSQGYCGGKPNVVTAHICVAAYLQVLESITSRNRVSLQSMASAEARFYRRYQGHVIAVSKKVAGELREFYQFAGPIEVIPHGVDTSRFAATNRALFRSEMRRTLGISDDATLALYVGDLTKAHTYLTELSLAAPKVQFVILTGSQRYRWENPNVHFINSTTPVERFYAAADAFVFPTTYDAFGMVALEAMASGLPVFSSDQAGVAELITTGTDGFVSPLKDWCDSTAAGIQNQPLLNRVGAAAEQTAQKHNWSAVTAAVERQYFVVAGLGK